MSRPVRVCAASLAAAVLIPAAAAEAKIVVRGNYKSISGTTITYSSSKGTFAATWIGVRHYRVRGTINGRKLRGSFRTHQAPSHKRFIARGSGRLGGKKVKIRGGGPNNLRKTTLVLK